jgi:hypothetical protein
MGDKNTLKERSIASNPGGMDAGVASMLPLKLLIKISTATAK